MKEGAYVQTADSATYSVGALELPKGYIKRAVGAGDAFCAGIRYEIYENWEAKKSALLGACATATSLSGEDSSSGLKNLKEVLDLAPKYPPSKFQIRATINL